MRTTARTFAGVQAKKPSEIRQNNGLCAVIMGPSGAGKTTLLLTLLENPTYLPCAVFDVDAKAHVLADNKDIDVYSATTWPLIDKYAQELNKSTKDYKTICWDGLAMMQAQSQDAAGVNTVDNPQIRQTRYGKANTNMVQLAQDSKILAERGINVFFNVWSTLEAEQDTGIVHVKPDLTATLLSRFIGVMDFVFMLEPAPPPKPYPPIMRAGGSQKYWTKLAVAPDSPLNDMPDVIYRPSLASILDTFHGKPWPTQKHAKQPSIQA